MPGYEHYDAVISRNCKMSSESEMDNCLEDTSTHVTDGHNTTDDGNRDQTPQKTFQQSDDFSEPDVIITPRKQAKYKSPKSKLLTRKKISKPDTWTRNVRKQKRQSGQSYTSTTGKVVAARKLAIHTCEKCRFKCGENVSEEERLTLFESYWNLQSYERQRDFICSHVLVRNTMGSPSKKRKHVARTFTFHIKGKVEKVCKNFFLQTLGIGKKVIETALLKQKTSLTTPLIDRRGKHQSHNRTPEADLHLVREHIESFVTVESHYTRKDTDRKYLSYELSIRKMYDLYKYKVLFKTQNPFLKRYIDEFSVRNITFLFTNQRRTNAVHVISISKLKNLEVLTRQWKLYTMSIKEEKSKDV